MVQTGLTQLWGEYIGQWTGNTTTKLWFRLRKFCPSCCLGNLWESFHNQLLHVLTSIGLLLTTTNIMLLVSVALRTPKSRRFSVRLGGSTRGCSHKATENKHHIILCHFSELHCFRGLCSSAVYLQEACVGADWQVELWCICNQQDVAVYVNGWSDWPEQEREDVTWLMWGDENRCTEVLHLKWKERKSDQSDAAFIFTHIFLHNQNDWWHSH